MGKIPTIPCFFSLSLFFFFFFFFGGGGLGSSLNNTPFAPHSDCPQTSSGVRTLISYGFPLRQNVPPLEPIFTGRENLLPSIIVVQNNSFWCLFVALSPITVLTLLAKHSLLLLLSLKTRKIVRRLIGGNLRSRAVHLV